MKHLLCKLCILLLVISFSSNTLTAKEFKKNIKKEYAISPNGTVALSNKYGIINVQTWSKNQVKIEVTITVNARNQGDADFVFEKININCSKSGDYIKAKTEIRKTSSSWADCQAAY